MRDKETGINNQGVALVTDGNLQLSIPESQHLIPPSLRIAKISLTSFRNYTDECLELDAAPVVLTGPNGSGKTNLLEAISMFIPGRGLRRALLGEMQNKNSVTPWTLSAKFITPQGTLRIGTGRDPDVLEKDRRKVCIEGKIVKSQQELAEYVAMAWITPDMDRLLADGSSARRKLLDRLVYSFDPAHAGRIHRYEKAMRERLRLLRDNVSDPPWLEALEDCMSQTGTAIAAARLNLLGQLQEAINDIDSVFPKADIKLCGVAEETLCNQPALVVEDKLRAELSASRAVDAESGTCSIGPHRSDLAVIHRFKQCPANLCSTGEQKALLIAIMLAYVRVLAKARRMVPIFLLDDITAHLDNTRRKALFDEIIALGMQAWLTGTDIEFFSSFLDMAQHFEVNNGQIL